MSVATLVISIPLALMFGAVGTMKVLGHPAMVENAQHLGFSAGSFRILGLLELAGAAGLLIGLAVLPLGIAAGVGLVLLMIGGAILHVRASDPVKAAAPAVVFGALTVVYVGLQFANA